MRKSCFKILSFAIFFTFVFNTGCRSKYGDASDRRIADEEQAEILLAKARQQLKDGEFDAAKSTLKTMRKSYPYALSCRKAGILLMDSIELSAAMRDTLQSDYQTRILFYQKKLQHDHRELSKQE